MSRKRRDLWRVLLPLLLFLFGCESSGNTRQEPYQVPPDNASIVLLGEVSQLAPGSQASFLVQLRIPYEDRALPGRTVDVYLTADGVRDQVFTGKTNRSGMVAVAFPVPEAKQDPNATVEVTADVAPVMEVVAADEAADEVAADAYPPPQREYYPDLRTLAQPVYIGRIDDLLLATDKPVYQPGQTIHTRLLALNSLALHAAANLSATITFIDPAGNKLLRQNVTTSATGVASLDFLLDGQAMSGDYVITAEAGPSVSTHTVNVKPYTLPRFKVSFEPDRPFYLPGETATGSVAAQYFFGKPVADAQVVLRSVGDRYAPRTEVRGKTDAEGRFDYAFPVAPDYNGQLDFKATQIELEIEVTDTAAHLERIEESLTVAEQPLLVDAVPESGRLRPELENLVYLDITYPDGSAVPGAAISLEGRHGERYEATADPHGLAVITVDAPGESALPLQSVITDSSGLTATVPMILGSATDASGRILLRTDRTEYAVGDAIQVDIFVADDSDTVYLDILKRHQSYALVPLPVVDGLATAEIPVDGSLLGTLELNAYLANADGEIGRDHRLVLVNPAPAAVSVTTDAEEYRPGDSAVLDIAVTLEGNPMPSTVGLAIVDESVYAMADQDAGFARTFFLLDRRLQEARYQVDDFSELKSDVTSPYDDRPQPVKYARQDGNTPAVAAAAQSRQLALAGFFAKELAAADATAAAPAAPVAPSPWAGLAGLWSNRLYLAAPLVGLALYDGSRRRRKLLIALTLFCLGAFFWSACSSGGAPSPAAAPAEQASSTVVRETASGAPGAIAQPPRLRQFFPETLYWAPELATDAQGRVQVEVPIADTITTWRISVVASDADGNLGSAELGLRVFQEFFVEPDLPRFLTVGDEVAVPVSVFNYVDEPQTVTLSLTSAAWFEPLGDAVVTLGVSPNDVTVTYLPIRVTAAGAHVLEIAAQGSRMSDAVARPVEVRPEGQPQAQVDNGILPGDERVSVVIPPDAIAGTGAVTVRFYPSVISQLITGLDAMLREPYGCFEQTSSVNYPNVMILRYLDAVGQASPELRAQAGRFIQQGYQRLLTFEVQREPGGFSLYGEIPADYMLTAYGLMQLGDMRAVAYVDPALLERTAGYLAEKQHRDGSWGAFRDRSDRNGPLIYTAYTAWGLAGTGFEQERSVRRAVDFLEGQWRELASDTAELDAVDNYAIALVANALLAANGDAQPWLDLLVARAEVKADSAYWPAYVSTYLGGYGGTLDTETTAIAAQALLKAQQAPGTAQGALNYLVEQQNYYGGYGSTQTTVQALKAFLLAAEEDKGSAAVTVTLTDADGHASTQMLSIDETNLDLVQEVRFSHPGGAAELTMTVEGERRLLYQVLTRYNQPWTAGAAAPTAEQPLRVDVHYDRTELQVGDVVEARAEVELLRAGTAQTLLVNLGLPPGFSPLTEDLDRLVDARQIDRYEVNGEAVVLYLSEVESGVVQTFTYRLQARMPVRGQVPGSSAYDYYAPDQRTTTPPQRIVVTLGTPVD